MIFHVVSISRALLHFFKGFSSLTVHSVYKDVVNLLYGNVLISIQNNHVPKTPMSIIIEEDMDFRSLLKAGDGAVISGKSITIGGNVFCIGEFLIWDPVLKSLPISNTQILISKVDILRKLLVIYGDKEGIGDTILNIINSLPCITSEKINTTVFNILANAILYLEQEKPEMSAIRAAELIGLGYGLTPSGDDFLVGLLSTSFIRIYHKNKTLLFYTMLKRRIEELCENTTIVSRGFLLSACKGSFSEVYHNIYLSMARDDAEGLYLNGARLIGTGHCSGRDGLSGILFGLYLAESGLLQ